MSELHRLLQDVADVRISPDAAADLLATESEPTTPGGAGQPTAAGTAASPTVPSGGSPADPASGAGDSTDGPEPGRDPRVERLALRISARGVRLIADPSVATVHVEGGPHRVRQEGGTLRVEADTMPPPSDDDDGYSQTDNPSQWRRWLSRRGVANNLVVRAHPSLPLEVAVDAGALDVTGWRAPIVFTVNAGSVKAHDCHGLVDGTVRAGSAKLSVLLPPGESRLHAEAGSLDLRLISGSDVAIHAQAELGSIMMADSLGGAKVAGSGKAEASYGEGTGSLDLSVTMGSIRVRAA
jgi:hypothetical protein